MLLSGAALLWSSPAMAATERAIFAGGCFWCMEKPFEQIDGVISVVSGYTNGSTTHPDYQNYSSGGHVDAV